jgi:hypothetical protein
MQDLPGMHGTPFIWALTGTPWEASPKDVETYINVLEDRDTGVPWDGPLYYATQRESRKIIRDHSQLVTFSKSNQQTTMRNNFQTRFGGILRALMIRRTVKL